MHFREVKLENVQFRAKERRFQDSNFSLDFFEINVKKKIHLHGNPVFSNDYSLISPNT